MTAFRAWIVFTLWFALLSQHAHSLKHSFAIHKDGRRFIGPIGTPYGFLQSGCFGLDVFDFQLEVARRSRHSNPGKDDELLQQVNAGFLLKQFPSESAFTRFHESVSTNSSRCVFSSFQSDDDDDGALGGEDLDESADVSRAASDGIFLPIKYSKDTGSWKYDKTVQYDFKENEDGLYFLMYQICPQTKETVAVDFRSTFEIDFHYKNKDNLGFPSFLTAGEMPLPTLYLYFFFSYLGCSIIWILNIRGIQRGKEGCFAKAGVKPVVYPIHNLMSALIVLKTVTVLFESVRYHYIRVTGHAEFWTFVYYTLTFLKGMFLFTVILLIGSGWSYLKPVLSDREKKVICVVITLQVIDNIALVILSTETVGESVYEDWRTLLHLVDIICCCVVLVPIVWQVNTLEKAVENQQQHEGEGEEERMESTDEQRTLAKLKKFRGFYLLVVGYIYFTRIAVYLFSTTLGYRHTWIRYFVTELATLGFYAITGLHMRPVAEHTYLALAKDDDQVEEIEMG